MTFKDDGLPRTSLKTIPERASSDKALEKAAKQNVRRRIKASQNKTDPVLRQKKKWSLASWELQTRKTAFAPRVQDHLTKSGQPIGPLLPTDPGFNPETMTAWIKSRKFNVVRYFSELFLQYRRHWLMANFVESLRMYFKHAAKLHAEAGKIRKTTWLNSFQSALSLFRRALKECLVPVTQLRFLGLSKEEKRTLENEKLARLEKGSENVVKIDGFELVSAARKLLSSDDPAELVIALAALTGRRSAEILVSGAFNVPQKIYRRPHYWCKFTGILKQREHDKDKIISRDIPLLAKRADICEAIARVRDLWPATTAHEANKLYSSEISKKMKTLFPLVGKLHTFRKTYCPITYEHFNDDLKFSLPRFASEVLTHKSIHGGRLLTYLNVNVNNTQKISFQENVLIPRVVES